jgi:hypothetical protein
LGYDFVRRQVPDKTSSRGEAEPASLSAANLTGNAQGVVVFFGNQDALDVIAVCEGKQEFSGSVHGDFYSGNLKPLAGQIVCKAASNRPAQIGHIIETVGLAKIDPPEDLCGAIALDASGLEQQRQLFLVEVFYFYSGHGAAFSLIWIFLDIAFYKFYFQEFN